MEENKSIIPLSQAVEAVKTAILQGQYEANKDFNRIQLAVYFEVGKYLSKLPKNVKVVKRIKIQQVEGTLSEANLPQVGAQILVGK